MLCLLNFPYLLASAIPKEPAVCLCPVSRVECHVHFLCYDKH